MPPRRTAAAWQQGYDLHEVTREWGWLHRCLVAAIEDFAAAQPSCRPTCRPRRGMKLADQISEAVSLSAEKYFRLERIEATGSVPISRGALADVRELERRRAELWQQAAHDLRGNLGVVSNVAQGLISPTCRRKAPGFPGPAAQQRHARCSTCSTT